MSIPQFSDFLMPVLKLGATGSLRTIEAVNAIYSQFNLSMEDRKRTIPGNKRRTVVYTRVGWAVYYMVQAGLLKRPQRGYFEITDEGKKVIAAGHKSIDVAFLKRYPGYGKTGELTVRQRQTDGSGQENETPEEKIGAAYEEFSGDLKSQVIQHVLECSPTFFEVMVVELIVAMGYGDDLEDAGEALGRSGDEGVDGLVKEDKLGLGKIYIQAKRYSQENHVGRPALQAFVGSLSGKGATKGVFFTTSYFSVEAKRYADNNTQYSIALIDGDRLAELMIEHNVGIRAGETIELKKVDEEYFEQ